MADEKLYEIVFHVSALLTPHQRDALRAHYRQIAAEFPGVWTSWQEIRKAAPVQPDTDDAVPQGVIDMQAPEIEPMPPAFALKKGVYEVATMNMLTLRQDHIGWVDVDFDRVWHYSDPEFSFRDDDGNPMSLFIGVATTTKDGVEIIDDRQKLYYIIRKEMS